MPKRIIKRRGLTGKQQAMIVERLKDKTADNAEVIKRSGYKVSNDHTASQIYYENMKNPEIAQQLDNVVNEMEDTLITVVRRYRDSTELDEVKEATTNARWIHDKVKGKAKQTIDTTSTTVKLSLSLKDIVVDENQLTDKK
jgi:hypothetical protein